LTATNETDLAHEAALAMELGAPGAAADDPVTHRLIHVGFQLECDRQFAEAAKFYRKVAESVEAWPDNRANAALRLGVSLGELGDLSGAAAAFQLSASTAVSHRLLRVAAFHGGCLLMVVGDHRQALELFQRLAELEPTSADEPSLYAANCLVAAARVRLGQGSEELPDPAALHDSRDSVSAFELARALDQTGHLEFALRFYTALAQAGDTPESIRQYAAMRLPLLSQQLSLREAHSGVAVTVPAIYAEVHRLVQPGAGKREIAEAARLCDLLPQDRSDHPELVLNSLMTVAFELEKAGSPNIAANLYRRVLDFPEVDAHHRCNGSFRLGLLLLNGENHNDAVDLLHEALDGNENLALIRAIVETLADMHARVCQWQEAREVVAWAVERTEHEPQESLYWQLRDVHLRAHGQEIADYDQTAATLLPSTRPESAGVATVWFQTAVALESCGYLTQARVFYDELMKCSELPPGMRTRLLYRLGLVLDRLMYFREAQEHLHAAVVSDDPEPEAQSEARMRLANLRFLMDEFDAAIDDFEDLRRTGVNGRVRSESQIRYATCLIRLGRQDEARLELEQSRTGLLNGTEFEVKADLMLAEMAESSENYKVAMICYDRVIHNPLSEPLTKAAALTRLSVLKKLRR